MDWIENLLAEQAQFYDPPHRTSKGVSRVFIAYDYDNFDFREKFLPFFSVFFVGTNIHVEEVAG